MLVEIFLKILNLSIGAIPLMAVILLLRLVFKKAVPRRIFYVAWALVFIRLMLPFSPQSGLSFFNLVPAGSVVESGGGSSVVFIENEGETVEFPVLSKPYEDNPSVDFPGEAPANAAEPHGAVIKSQIDLNLILGTVWAFGAAALLAFGTAGYFTVLGKLRFESVPYSKNISFSEMFKTPVVCGLFKPKIILPPSIDMDDGEKMTSVIFHETTHIRRGDNFWRLLAAAALYIHWFNPLAWLCYCAFIRDMEVSCDEAVLARSKKDIRGQYAESLVALAGDGASPLYGGALAFGESGIKERVERIMNFKKAKILVVIICLAVVAALGVIFLTGPVAKPEEEKEVSFITSSVNGEKAEFTQEDGLKALANFTNDGESVLWLSPEHVLEKLSEGSWQEFEASFPNSGTTMVNPGETVVFFDGLPAESFSEEPAAGTYRVRRAVFLDQKLTESAGFAECLFNIAAPEAEPAPETETKPETKPNPATQETTVETKPADESGFYGAVTSCDMTGSKYIPVASTLPQTVVWANSDQQKYCEKLIDNMDINSVSTFIVGSTPGDTGKTVKISRDRAGELLDILKKVKFVTSEPFNPNTPAMTSIYIVTASGDYIMITWDSSYLILYQKGQESAYRFKGSACTDEFNELINAADEMSVKGSAVQMEYYYPGDEGKGYFITSKKDLTIDLFCNDNKTYVKAQQGKSLLDLLKYDNFENLLSATTSTEGLGEALSEVSTMEIARADGKKYALRLYEKGFVLTGSAVPEDRRGLAYIIKEKAWSEFKLGVTDAFSAAKTVGPYWLGLIKGKNVSSVAVENVRGRTEVFPGDDCFDTLINELRIIAVSAPPESFDSSEFALPSGTEEYVLVTVNFNTGTQYSVLVSGSELRIVSSDMDYGLTYTIRRPTSVLTAFASYVEEQGANPETGKPVIYLYPEKRTDVSVKLDFDGTLTYTYPAYENGWNVTAEPDGTLINKADGSTHYYLFWEGTANPDWPHESGFVVKGAETEAFLKNALAEMGLTPREYNDFITYWVPKMQGNKYNLISFSGSEYTETAKLTVLPKPDSVLRVHMVWMALDEPIEIPAQSFEPFERSGFTLVEWGGTEVFE